MLDSLYGTLFRPAQERHSTTVVLAGLGLLLAVILALNAAGTLGLGVSGVVLLAIAFLVAGLGAWFWLAASVHFLAQWLGGDGQPQATLAAIAQSFWPLVLTPPVLMIRSRVAALGAVLSLAIALWIVVALVQGIRQAHHLGWGQALLCLGLTGLLVGGALLGLILWPLMLLAGT